MIKYEDFKKFFNIIEIGKEIEVIFNDNKSCFIVKQDGYLSYGLNNIQKYSSLDDTSLRKLWNNVEDIIIDSAFSLINDKDDILKVYNYKI